MGMLSPLDESAKASLPASSKLVAAFLLSGGNELVELATMLVGDTSSSASAGFGGGMAFLPASEPEAVLSSATKRACIDLTGKILKDANRKGDEEPTTTERGTSTNENKRNWVLDQWARTRRYRR